MLTLLAVAGRVDSISGVGEIVLALAAATVVYALVDMGLCSMTVREYSSGRMTERRQILRPLGTRLILDLISCAIVVAWLFRAEPLTYQLGWTISAALYCAGLHASSLMNSLAYGMMKFRSGAIINGLPRLGTVPCFIGLAIFDLPLQSLIITLAAFEFAIAVAQFRRLAGASESKGSMDEVRNLRLSQTWRIGVSAVLNIAINKSDAILVGLVASTTIVGTYGLASQVENALATLALVPAGALVAYTARAGRSRDVIDVRRRVGTVVVAIYICIAFPLLIWTESITRHVFGLEEINLLAIRVCIFGGMFLCLASVALQQLTALGQQTAVLAIWIVASITTVVFMTTLTSSFGALGAAVAAFLRDVFLFLAASIMLWYATRDRPSNNESVNAGA